METGPYYILISALVILGLLIINGIITAIHTSLISLDINKLKEMDENGDSKAKSLIKIISNQDGLNQSFAIMNMLLSLITIAYFAKKAQALDIDGHLPSKYLVILAILIYIFIKVIFVDKIPERIGVIYPIKISKTCVGLTKLILVITKPIVKFSTSVTNLFMKIFGIEAKIIQKQVTAEQIKSIIQIGEDQGILRPMESKMIHSIMNFDDLLAEEVMTARPDVFMIDINDEEKSFIDEFIKMKHARIPVYESELDNILGILYTKDYLLKAAKVGLKNVDISKLIKPAYFAPDKIETDKLFSKMQKEHIHMAVLIDEYGGFSGVVTIEDLIEEIVGDLDDSYDRDTPEIMENERNVFVVKASVSIKDLNEKIGIDIDEENESYDSLGGFIIDRLGYIPEEGSNVSLSYNGFEIKILYIEDRRIKACRIRKLKSQADKKSNK